MPAFGKAIKPFISLSFILVGVGIGALICFCLFPKIPSDFARSKTLLHFVRTRVPSGATLVFGNSIVMDGFDAKLFSAKACSPECFNLSSPGQNQLESLLLIASLKTKPARIIHFFSSYDVGNQDYLSQQTIQNFLLYGYSPDAFVLESLAHTNNATSMSQFHANPVSLVFESRWLVTNYINTQFRNLLRKDLTLQHIATELYYPRNYTVRLPEQQRQSLINQFNPRQPVAAVGMDTVKLFLIKRIGQFLADKGIAYTVVFSPMNPALDHYMEGYKADVEAFCQTQKVPNTTFVNLSGLLSKEEFVDHYHPNAEGAKKITHELAQLLSKCSSRP